VEGISLWGLPYPLQSAATWGNLLEEGVTFLKVLMLGWEFPPFISGGLGTACYGLTKGMSELGTEIVLVLPRSINPVSSAHVKLLGPQGHLESEFSMSGHVKIRSVDVALYPYTGTGVQAVPVGKIGTGLQASAGASSIAEALPLITGGIGAGGGGGSKELYTRDMYTEVYRYMNFVRQIAKEEQFDVIHAHDWMTYPAGVTAASVSGKPLVVHVHSTEFDRSGENVNQWIYDIERWGMNQAHRVITVSGFTRQICLQRYSVAYDKVEVVYNAMADEYEQVNHFFPAKDEKVVLFLGRITMQKGPEYFIAAARKVLTKMDNVKFIVAGSGDMMHRMIEMAAHLGLGHKILFAGFLKGRDVGKAFRMADLYVMPSVSEPFGIAPLEALAHEVPAIISKQSGVAEVLSHVLKVDFWDIDELANKIVAVLKYPALYQTLRDNGTSEARKLRWIDSARKCVDIYKDLLRQAS
jgi:glycogen(starch) synthase